MKWLDLPPIWLIAFIAVGWLQDTTFSVGPQAPAALKPLAALLVLSGIVLTGLAALRFAAARTTIIPHLSPSALVTGGIYRFSRNPIYLGDAAILLGAVLWWGAWPSLVLVPLFVWVITARFIKPEEARLAAAFPKDFANYVQKTRRWL